MTKEEFIELIEEKLAFGVEKYLDARLNFHLMPREYWDGYTDALEDVIKEASGDKDVTNDHS